jgi:serine phosphatase RsbU (regulator of sigma subunit)
VLCLVDRKIELFELNTTVTMACAVMSPPFDRMQLAVAGHPLPVIALPDQPAAFPEANIGPLLGLSSKIKRTSTDIPLEPGTTVVFYTDGLIERRHEDLDDGLERLRSTVDARSSPQLVLHEVMRALIGNTEPEDDVAVLALRTSEIVESASG